MLILGINEGIDSSVVVLENGRIKFALQEERVNRIKNCVGVPHQAVQFALKHLGLQPSDFQAVCLSNIVTPPGNKAKFLEMYSSVADEGDQPLLSRVQKAAWREISRRVPSELKRLKREFYGAKRNEAVNQRVLDLGFSEKQLVRSEHHFNHAAAAYYGLRKNSHEPHLVMTVDGGGDRCCSHVYLAKDGRMELIAKTPDGHSIGNIYSRVTHLMGMTPHEHEYKLMGLSAYLKDEKYIEPVLAKFRSYLDLHPENPLVFQCKVPEMSYGIQPRLAHDFKRVRFDNLAAGLQLFTEELLVRWVQEAVKKTGVRNVLGSGGVFMNVKANKLIAELSDVEFFDVFPSCGDETLSFGGAWKYYAENSKTRGEDIEFGSFYLGPDAGFDLEQAKGEFSDRLEFKQVEAPEKETARLLSEGKIVARCSGRMEFGARALGNRSILADPGDHRVVPEINKMIKQRDFWMPFAPAMIREGAESYINIPHSLPKGISPYMMHSFDTTDRREEMVAGTHAYDRTARAQIVLKEYNPEFHKVISEFARLKNKSVVLNTSFNLHGFPIVMGARDAMGVMVNSSLSYLMVNDTLVTKKTQTS